MPAAPRARAGPFHRCATSCAWAGCSQVIHDSIGSVQAASRNASMISSSDRSAYCASGLGFSATCFAVGVRRTTRGGHSTVQEGHEQLDLIGGQACAAPGQVTWQFRSPQTTIRPSRAATLWRPTNASSGTTSVGGTPAVSSSDSTAAVFRQQLAHDLVLSGLAAPGPALLDARLTPFLHVDHEHAARTDEQDVDVRSSGPRPGPVGEHVPAGVVHVDEDPYDAVLAVAAARQSPAPCGGVAAVR